MTDSFQRIVAQVADEGRRLYARWSGDQFHRLCQAQARTLWERLAEHPDPTDETTLSAYLTLLREGVGAGYLARADHGDGQGPRHESSFLESLLLRLVPEALAAEPPETRAGWLATVWNLGEGIRGGPPWIDGYVSAFATELTQVRDVESFLARTLEPAIEPVEPAAWKGPFALAVVDTRKAHDPFLPGAMHLTAPTVLCVQDRRDPAVYLGILLRRGGRSRILGLFPSMGAYDDEGVLPEVRTEENRVRVGKQAIDLPMLGTPYGIAQAGGGFIVASALDSQRLWIVESA